jgi:ribulose kinase
MTLLAVDVGTLSARAGLFTPQGEMLATEARPFPLRRPAEDQGVYRLDDIFAAVTAAVRACAAQARALVTAMAFDATSSVALEYEGAPPLADAADVIGWMDHRGAAIAAEITASGDRLIDHAGGTLSPEMHLPKLLWLKRHDPAAWRRVRGVRDLCDALAWRATGVDVHSACGLACKWPYLPGYEAEEGDAWRRRLLARLGIADLLERGALCERPRPVGALHGGLLPDVAEAMGLPPGLPVAVGLIDGEAGALGVLGRGFAARINRTLAVVAGTSTCIMAFAAEERIIPGVWGPFRDAVFPGLWLHEAGQSLTGGALDQLLLHHPAAAGHRPPAAGADEPARATAADPERVAASDPVRAGAGGEAARVAGGAEHARLAAAALAAMAEEGPAFAARRHVLPDWQGNRAPIGDARLRAMLVGVGSDTGPRALLESYFAAARGIALQVRHIAEHLSRHRYAIDRFVLAGGHANNPLLVRLYRDALPGEFLVSAAREPVLLGTAMVAAAASGRGLAEAVEAMAQPQTVLAPDPLWRTAHDRAYRIFQAMTACRASLEAEMDALAGLARPPARPTD